MSVTSRMESASRPSALVLRAPGTNCDAEMCRAFEMAGANVSLVHLDRLVSEPSLIERFELIGIPGGFSYGDDIASGRIFAMRLREYLYPALRDAARRGVPMIGACNGFQVLVQVGLLPGPVSGADWPEESAPTQTCALAHNSGGRFIDRWCRVSVNPASNCVWTQGLSERWPVVGERTSCAAAADAMMLPIAHGEGRFVCDSPATLQALVANNQVAMTYLENPNGSTVDVAGICDASGRIFGLMPHPERYLEWTQHPFWTRLEPVNRTGVTPGLLMFQNAVAAALQVRV